MKGYSCKAEITGKKLIAFVLKNPLIARRKRLFVYIEYLKNHVFLFHFLTLSLILTQPQEDPGTVKYY